MAITVRISQQGNEGPVSKTTQPFNLKGAKKAVKKKDAALEPDADDSVGGAPDNDVDDKVELSQVKKQGSDKGKTSSGKMPAKGKRRFGLPGSPIRF